MKQTFTIDPAHSSANFSIRHLMITNVRGSFSNVTGTVVYDPANPSDSSIQAEIDANSLSTGDAQRDGHVKSPEFLHVEQHPKITFQSTKVEKTGDGEFKVTGNLTLHGTSKPVVLTIDGPTAETKDPWGNIRVGASATAKIKRSDFGVVWNATLETGGVALSDDLKIELELSLVKQQAATA
ncbi:MAG TPA: YceI family protein [Bryobacteraceae bacterium]|jgi:polyisoprenoid-binding protein YceI|nr:YceI family protein [Bryobacteraceae bacterium]